MAVWAQQAKIDKWVVETVAIDVIQLQRNATAHPICPAALRTACFEHTLREQALAKIRGIPQATFHQQLSERRLRYIRIALALEMSAARPMRCRNAVLA